MKSGLSLKSKLGRKLREYRHSHHLRLEHVAKQSGVPWQLIDAVELGERGCWRAYKLLLEFYGKSVSLELVDGRPSREPTAPLANDMIARYRSKEPVIHNRVEEVLPIELS